MTLIQRLSLPHRNWPARDRALWDIACAPGDVFESGIASHLLPRSQTTIERGYTRWLGYLARAEPSALDLSPEDRITRTRVKAYVDDVSGRCSPTTVWNDVKALYDMARFMVPATDWTWLKSVKATLERRIQRRRSPVIDTPRLIDLGFALMTDGIERLQSDRLVGALAYRDGLLIAFLAYRPLRRRTLAALTIGQQLQQIGATWMLILDAADLKNQRDADFSWPEPLVPALERYLADIRPLFPGASSHAGLWPSIKGRPMGEEAIYEAVRNRTKAALGIAINLHAFRHSSATTIAMHRPEALGIAAPLLTHADPRATERHYNLARHIEAGRAQTTIIDQLRARMRRAAAKKGVPDVRAKHGTGGAMMFEDDLLDIQQAAAFLRCSVDTLRRVPRSQLPVYRPGRHNLYFRRDLMAFARTRPAGAGAKMPTAPDAPLKDQDLVDFVADRVRERSSINRRTP